MRFFKKLGQQVHHVKRQITNIYEKVDKDNQKQNQNQQSFSIDGQNDLLRSSLKFSTYAPLIVQSYIILYSVYAFYTIIKVIILAPIQFILGFFNIIFQSLKLYTSQYVTMHSLVVIVVAYIFTLNQDIFDISFMYHLIRGQSTVKVYAIIFAIQSSQIVMTKLGTFLYYNIKTKLDQKDLPFYKLSPQFLVQSLYVFCHAYIIYIDFLIYSVVLNSSLQSFIIFWSVVYLTKMKTAPSFGIGMDKYKVTLTQDSKYRLSRVCYLALFLANQIGTQIPSFWYKFIFIIFVQQIFIIIKHLLYLLSSYTGNNDKSAITIRDQMYKMMYSNHDRQSVDRCVTQNFTVLPFTVFTIKIITIIIQSNWDPNFLAYFTYYLLLCLIQLFFILLIVGIKSGVQFLNQRFNQKKIKNPQEQTPLLNSFCVDVIHTIVDAGKNKYQQLKQIRQNPKQEQENDQQKSQAMKNLFKTLAKASQNNINQQDKKSQISSKKTIRQNRLRKAPSIFQGLLLHTQVPGVVLHKQNLSSNQRLSSNLLQQVDQQNEDNILNQSSQSKASKKSKKSTVSLRKIQSHLL